MYVCTYGVVLCLCNVIWDCAWMHLVDFRMIISSLPSDHMCALVFVYIEYVWGGGE